MLGDFIQGLAIDAMITTGVALFLAPGILGGLWAMHRGDQLESQQVHLPEAARAAGGVTLVSDPATAAAAVDTDHTAAVA
jgi:hypothetical protein